MKFTCLSQLEQSAKDRSERLISESCAPYPYDDSLVNGRGIDFYKGTGFCEILGMITEAGAGSFTIVPNWRCNGTDDFCRKSSPFVSDENTKATDESFKGVKLYTQNVKCEQKPARKEMFSNMAVVADGIRKSSTGQLYMAGCLGIVDSEGNTCNSRICLYIPLSFSIKQHGIIFGSFSGASRINDSYFPSELWNYFRNSHPYFSYSKIEKAGVILEINDPFSFQTCEKIIDVVPWIRGHGEIEDRPFSSI
ncbi:hypothetical protein OIU77_031240 [Salix suchowensis]|uniref:DUF2921 domain-containing protein n=1 Tax=Salix suchowensis TaxID=1278906 RepID=A0ABQ9BET5_9ROSI|nr:hypothetical protein OIU77_031240 [Salix suchowensis]